MIDEYEWQLSLCSGSYPTCQEDSVDHQPESVVTPDTTIGSVTAKSVANDIKVLTDRYGSLIPAKLITIDLDTACELLGRDRHRVDAFSKLQRYLYQEYQVTLKITSRKTH